MDLLGGAVTMEKDDLQMALLSLRYLFLQLRVKSDQANADVETAKELGILIEKKFDQAIESLKSAKYDFLMSRNDHVNYLHGKLRKFSKLIEQWKNLVTTVAERAEMNDADFCETMPELYTSISTLDKDIREVIKEPKRDPPYYMQNTDNLTTLLKSLTISGMETHIKPKLILMLTKVGRYNLSRPSQLIASGTNSVLLVDYDIPVVLQITVQGDTQAQFYPSKSDAISSAAVNGGNLYISTVSSISLVSRPPSFSVGKERKNTWEPNLARLQKILLVDDQNFIVSDNVNESVYTYNIANDKLRRVVHPLEIATFMSISRNCLETRYIVTSRHCVCVYNENWMLNCQIGDATAGSQDGMLNVPAATVVIENTNCVLIADSANHRISMFTLDGHFIKHILTRNDGIRFPVGLAYVPPYVWVTEWRAANDGASVKCFSWKCGKS